MSIVILAGLSTFTIAQDAAKSSSESESAAPNQAQPAANAATSSSGRSAQPSASAPPRPAPRAFKPSEEVRADTVLSLPADI